MWVAHRGREAGSGYKVSKGRGSQVLFVNVLSSLRESDILKPRRIRIRSDIIKISLQRSVQ